MPWRVLSVAIERETDLVLARQRARQIARLIGFYELDQTRITTAVSELARNALDYAGGGRVDFSIEGEGPQAMVIRVSDTGPGIADLENVLNGAVKSATGLGLGLRGTRRLVDEFAIDSRPGAGTVVRIAKQLPPRAAPMTDAAMRGIAGMLAKQTVADPLDELRQQNHDLLVSLEELRLRGEELEELNRELHDTNRGVVALYAELEDRAEHLRRTDEIKTRFLSNVSHEFRTPLNSMLALSRLLLDRTDGELTPEQEKQVRFILQAAQNLADLVNDLLDLAKVEAGKTEIHVAEFTVDRLFASLRGMLRPLLDADAVALVVEDGSSLPPLCTDEGKVSQILRNFVSNAIKFTSRGEVRVWGTADPRDDTVAFFVRDTGIGIDPKDQDLIFQEFTQIENPMQKLAKGTGLGLPLSRKLAELIGGEVAVESVLGVGSTFSLRIPRSLTAPPQREAAPAMRPPTRVLVIDDEATARYLVRQFLAGQRIIMSEAAGGAEGLRRIRDERPDVVLLDLQMPEVGGFKVLEELNAMPGEHPRTIILTSAVIGPEERRRLAGAAGIITKDRLSKDVLVAAVEGDVLKVPA
jgi:signal transduction histidine kinase